LARRAKIAMDALQRRTPAVSRVGLEHPGDVACVLVAVASVMIVAYDVIFLGFAVRDANWELAAKYAAIAALVGVANVAMDALRRWWRHHA
jgi:hypothetical protein